MTTLAVDKVRKFRGDSRYIELPAVASDIMYLGSAGGDSSGTVRPLSAGDGFLGFVDAQCDNSAGAASAKNVRLRITGSVYLSVTSVASTDDIGVAVYASDDNVFTLASTNNSAVGKVEEWDTGTNCWVRFEAVSARSI